MNRRSSPEEQYEFDFAAIESFVSGAGDILNRAYASAHIETSPDIESEAEFHVELAAACKKAITESGMSREQVLDLINELFGRIGGSEDAKKPISIHVFNNYLSKPHECPIPSKIVRGICVVTGSTGPVEAILSGMKVTIISSGECAELLLGKMEQHRRALDGAKRQLLKTIQGKGK